MLSIKYQLFRSSNFRGKDFSISANKKQVLPVAAMFVDRMGRNEEIFIKDRSQMLPVKYQFIWLSSFRA